MDMNKNIIIIHLIIVACLHFDYYHSPWLFIGALNCNFWRNILLMFAILY